MATIIEKTKDGKIVSFKFRVSLGRDENKRQIVTEELAENMREGPDPERISRDNNQLKLQLRQEITKRQRRLGERKLSEEDMAKIMARIASARMGLYDDEKELFEQLYLMMMRHRAKKDPRRREDSMQKRRTG